MGETEINMLLGALEEARNEHSRQLGYVFSEIKAMRQELSIFQAAGCSKYQEHLKTQEEIKKLSDRTTVIELKSAVAKGELRGIVMTVSFIGTVIGAVIAFVIDWLKK